MQCVIGHSPFRGETLNFAPLWLAHRWTDQHQTWHIWLPRRYKPPNQFWWKSVQGVVWAIGWNIRFWRWFLSFFPFSFIRYIDQKALGDFRRLWLIRRGLEHKRSSRCENQGKHDFWGSFTPKPPQNLGGNREFPLWTNRHKKRNIFWTDWPIFMTFSGNVPLQKQHRNLGYRK